MALDVIQAPQGTWLRAGGTSANVAADLAFLGWSARAIGMLGADDAGEVVKADLTRAGVDTTGILLKAGVGTPLVLHRVADDGHKFRFGCERCGRAYSRHRPLSRADLHSLALSGDDADVFFFDRPTSSAISMAYAFKSSGKVVMYEPATLGSAERHSTAITVADIVKFSDHAARDFLSLRHLRRAEQLWIQTQGARGSAFVFGDATWHRVDPFLVEEIDAGGAGDWMTAALLTQLPQRKRWTRENLEKSVRFANAVAALSCLVPGARSLAEVVSPTSLRKHATKLVHGAPALEFAPSDDTADNLCEACRLPLKTA